MEKLDYTVSWMEAHIQDATSLGKPMLVEEFGKAISAAKVFQGGVEHPPQKGVYTLQHVLRLCFLYFQPCNPDSNQQGSLLCTVRGRWPVHA